MAAAELIGQKAAEGSAQGHADEAYGCQPGGLGRRDSPVHSQSGHDEGDETDVHGVEGPANAGAEEKTFVFAGDGKAVEPLRARDRAMIKTIHAG